MASDVRMGESVPHWRRAPEAAQDPQGLESSRVAGVLPRSMATDPALPGYQEPPKLSYSPGPAMDKGCPWRGSEGCVEPAGLPLGCPYLPAPQRLQDALCCPKDATELPLLLAPRNRQPKGWAEPCKEPPRWAEAVLAPLALYSHAYHRSPLPFPAADSQHPGTAGKPRTAACGDGDPPAFRSCPFLVEAKHSPFLLSSLLPAGPPPEPGFGGGAPEGPTGARRFAGTNWCLGSYVPAWGAQPLYLGVPPRCKAAPAPFEESSSSGNKELYLKKEPSFHLQAKNQPQLPGEGQPGHNGDGDPGVPEPLGAPWRDGRAGGIPAAPPPPAHTPPLSTTPPLLLPQPSMATRGPWVGTRPHATIFPQCKPKDERPAYQSLKPGSLPVPGGAESLMDRHYPTAPPCPPGGCGVLGPFDAPGPDSKSTPGGKGGRFPCPPSIHTKLKKTWLTRHSEQSGPCCKGGRRDGPEVASEGKRSAKRPHSATDGHRAAAEGAGAAKRGTKATKSPGGTGSGGVPAERMEVGEGGPPVCAGRVGLEPWCLQSVPCTALPKSIPRCCACTARAAGSPGDEDEDEELPESTCRLLHFRRLTFGDGGELNVDGFCTLDQAEGEMLGLEVAAEGWSRSTSSSLCLAKYLLLVLGDLFCAAVCRDRDAWLGACGQPGGLVAWRRGEGAPQLCDTCQRGFFNSHWSCTRCGFQLCSECHRSQQEEARHGDPAWPQRCTLGQDHDPASLVPTQFTPTHVLAQLWQLLHEVRAKFDIKSHCPCGDGDAEKGPAEPSGSRQEKMGSAGPPLLPSTNGETGTARSIKEESPKGGPPSPPVLPHPRGAMQTATLCDLLASTADKLCLGHNGVRMAFAPVVPPLPSDNRLTSILDSIIAWVVERKIQERHAGCELSCPGPPGPPASHCILAPGGLLWLQDPGHATNYRLFQEHWQQGQPVLVSGLEKRLDGRLWGPESFCPLRGEQEVEAVNLRAQQQRVRMGSKRFWDGFAASATCPGSDQGAGDLWKLESGFGDMQLCRATNLSASLPLPEYCGSHGRLNLASYLRGEQGRRWLRPRVCAAYGVHPQAGSIGTKNLTVEAADTISVLVHAAERPAAHQEPLLQAEMDGMDKLLMERLQDAGSRPGALWHIFRAKDASRIQDFLHKVDQGQGGLALEPPGRYLDLALRQRLREECGVSGWTLLQCLGDAVLVPAGAPHQVQNLTGTISVEQRFLSPESAARLGDRGTGPQGAARWLRAQLDGMILAAVREAVGVLQGCK